jgi:aryl-alcohol dehydrogenase-like predicted oxidoreductase
LLVGYSDGLGIIDGSPAVLWASPWTWQAQLTWIGKILGQPRYNLLFRQIERELLPLAAETGMAVIPYNPLAGGLLSGKYGRDDQPTEGRFSAQVGQQFADLYNERYWHTKAFDTIDRLTKIASELGTSLATLSTAWVLANPTITSAILGASRPDQLTDTLAAADLDLPDDAKVALDDLTHEYRWGDAAR